MFPDEWIENAAGFPALCSLLLGSPDKPLVVFIPGGGFLARIAYGHPGCDRTAFLATSLHEMGFSVLSQSYPTDHPVFEHLFPEMTVRDWGQSAAAIAAKVARRERLNSGTLLVGWSMAGRMCRVFTSSVQNLGMTIHGFISLSAHPPLPGSAPLPEHAETLTSSALWNVLESAPFGVPYLHSWLDQVQTIANAAGEPLIPEDVLKRHYLANCPINLRGEGRRMKAGNLVYSLDDAISDQGSYDYDRYPLMAAIVPMDPTDALHALTGQSTFAFLNSRQIYNRTKIWKKKIDPATWDDLRDLMAQLPHRLTRFQEGGHFFFVGAKGAKSTAKHIADLVGEIAAINRFLDNHFAEGIE
jgi:hypothetical protein